MLHGRGHEPIPALHTDARLPSTGAVIRRLVRDYVGGQWGLLVLAIFCMLIASARWAALLPWLVNWDIKYVFHAPCSAACCCLCRWLAFGIMALRAVVLFFGRMLIDSVGEKTRRRGASATCSPA